MYTELHCELYFDINLRVQLPHGGSSASMATTQLQLKLPDNFNFKQPDNWLK